MSKPEPITFHVLIPAAGSSERLGLDIPKQFLKINKKPIIYNTVESFLKVNGVKSISVIINADHSKTCHDALNGINVNILEVGGESRKETIFNALKLLSNKLDEDYILIHDAARPFVEEGIINAVLEALKDGANAVTPACPVSDTIYDSDDRIVPREKLESVQTPQGFKIGLLRQAHELFKDRDDFTDDASMMAAMGHSVKRVKGSSRNFKITTQDDLKMAQSIMAGKMETRTGQGFDVHKFTDSETGTIRLCGIDIPHSKSLAGHSDADVGLHALTDALLGCIAAGDIGTHFPPSDPQWKKADSMLFLKKAKELVEEQDGIIVHTDLTLICEEPKIGPHRQAMQKTISDILGIAEDNISIKATTTEGLGFTGRREGIAAQALATIKLPVEKI